MAQVEVALDHGSVVVSYDPELVRSAVQALEDHDKLWRARRRALDEDEDGYHVPALRRPRGLVVDPDRVNWQVAAYTLSHTAPRGPRLVLLEETEDDTWVLAAVDETEDAAEQVVELNDAPYGAAAAMLEDFLVKAEADRSSR